MIGTTLQNYYIESLLGEGGMGRVYKATDTVLGRQVAIKSLNIALTNQPSFLERFKNEAKTLARLAHPNIAVLYNYLKEGNDYYMVMEYVEGENLDELTKRNKTLPCEVIVPLMVQALEGLEHAHKKGVLHRDIKPANLMLTPESMVKLMDFGIAKVSGNAKLTQTSRVIGTIEFLAPELIEGEEPSPASDIYAAGVTMYEMLTGRLPFNGKSDYMLMQEIVKEKPAAPVTFNANTPAALSDIILKTLEKKPADRFESAAAFSRELQTAFPGFQKIPAGFINQVTETKAAVASSANTVLHSAAPETMLYKESPATQLYTGAKEQDGLIRSFSKNRLIYIAAAVLLVIGITAFALFSGRTGDNKLADNVQDTTTVTQDVSNDDVATDNNLVTGNNVNNDSINFILNKEKQEEQQTVLPVQTEKITTDNKKPATKKPTQKTVEAVGGKTPEKPTEVEQEAASKTPEKPAPETDDDDAAVSLSGPIKLRGHGMPVMLALRENLSKKTASEGQHITFKVVEPAMLKGNVIIPSGSVINATIKGLGLIRMSIIFNSVNVNGKQMRLDRSEAGASMEKVFSGNTFKINLNGTLNP
ncbi:MAG TPA: protein kinase [Parafilimonas sp.]|nr:protein kinase [Parafilimonas sp.]